MALERIAGILRDGSEPSTDVELNPRRALRIAKGTSLMLVFDVTNPAGKPVDLALVVPVVFTVRKNPEPFANVPPAISRVGIIPAGAPRGRTTFELVPLDTLNLSPGQYVWDVKAKVPPGNWNSLVGASPFQIEPAVGYPEAPLTAPGGVTFYYAYPPLVASLALLGTNPRELGQTLSNPAFTIAYNRPASAAAMSDGTNVVALVSPFTAVTMPFAYNQTAIGGEQIFTLTASETGGPNLTAQVQVVWQPRVFWGSRTPGAFDEAFIESLSDSVLLPSRVYSPGFSAGAGEFLYFCVPTAYGGSPGDFTNAATGIAMGISKVAAGVPVTNAFGVTLPYDVWQSDVDGLGAITMQVSG